MLKHITVVAFFSVNCAFCGQKFQNLDSFAKFSIISNGQLHNNIKDRMGGDFLADHRLPFERIEKAVAFLSSTICDFNYRFQDVLSQPAHTINMDNVAPIISVIAPINTYLHNQIKANRDALTNFLTDFTGAFEEHMNLLVQEMAAVFNNFDFASMPVVEEADDFIVASMQDQCLEIQTIAMCIADQEYLASLQADLQKLNNSLALGDEHFSLYDSLSKWVNQGDLLGFPELIQQNKRMFNEIADLKKTVSFLIQLLEERL
jgi:hypothetical protein